MFRTQRHRPLSKAIFAVGVVTLCAGILTACSGFAGGSATNSDGTPVANKPLNPGPREQPEVPAEATTQHTTLPTDFPTGFVVPADSKIVDTGKRGESWYLVLEVAGSKAGKELVQQIADKSMMELSPAQKAADSISYTLNGNGLSALAILLPGTNGYFQLSFDIARA